MIMHGLTTPKFVKNAVSFINIFYYIRIKVVVV